MASEDATARQYVASTSLLLPSSSRQSDRNCPSSSRLSRSLLLVPACLPLRPVAGIVVESGPLGLLKHLHKLAGSKGESTAKSKVTQQKKSMGTFRGLYFRGVMVPANIAKIFPP